MAAATSSASLTAAGRPQAQATPPRPPPPQQQQQQQPQNCWHATYEDYLDTFLTPDDAFFFDGDLDTARALVETGLRARGAGVGRGRGGSTAATLTRREWTLAHRRALRAPLARHHQPRPPPSLLLLFSDPSLLPASECPLLAVLAARERAVRAGSLAVVVFLRARNAGGQEVSACVDLAARLGVGAPDAAAAAEEEVGEQQACARRAAPEDDDDDDDGDDGDDDAAERRAAAADRRARDASRGMAGVFARVRPFLPLPTDLCYYNHATRRARANPTAQWQVAPAFGEGGGGDDGSGGDGYSGGRLLLRHVRDRRVLDVYAPCTVQEKEAHASSSSCIVVELGGFGGGGNNATTAATATATATPSLLLSEHSYLLQAVVFDHVVRRR